MRFPGPLVPATFLDRPNRFLGNVQINGRHVQCFISNPGRMKELLQHGAKVYLLERSSEKRKTGHDLVLVDHEGRLVSIDSMMPNRIVTHRQ